MLVFYLGVPSILLTAISRIVYISEPTYRTTRPPAVLSDKIKRVDHDVWLGYATRRRETIQIIKRKKG